MISSDTVVCRSVRLWERNHTVGKDTRTTINSTSTNSTSSNTTSPSLNSRSVACLAVNIIYYDIYLEVLGSIYLELLYYLFIFKY